MRQRFAGALARELDQPQRRKTAHHGLDPVASELLFELGQHRLAVFVGAHINKVGHDDAAQVAQAQLARQGLGGF